MGRRTLMILTSMSALMVVLSFEPIGWWGFALLAWSPFFMVIRELKPKKAFRYGILHGMLSFGITLSWFWNIFSVAALALWLLMALFPAIWAYLHTLLRDHTRSFHIPLGAMIFVALEYFRSELFFLAFPWITPGTGLPPNLITSMFGTYGVSFFVVLSSLFLTEPGKRTEFTGLGIALVILSAIWMTPEEAPETSEPLKVALLQGNEPSLDTSLARSSVLPGLVDVIVWPEYAIKDDPHRNSEIAKQISVHLKKRAKTLIAGGPLWHDVENKSWSSTAFTFTEDGLDHWHFKIHPVHFHDDGVPGNDTRSFEISHGKIGTPVGSDGNYQDVIRKMTADGAEMIFIPTMNREKWSRAQHLQQAVHLRHRASENGRWIAQAATSGVTQIVDSYGNVVKRLRLNEKDTLLGELCFESRKTIYQRGGWLFGPINCVVTLIITALALYKIYRKPVKKTAKTEAVKAVKSFSEE